MGLAGKYAKVAGGWLTRQGCGFPICCYIFEKEGGLRGILSKDMGRGTLHEGGDLHEGGGLHEGVAYTRGVAYRSEYVNFT